MKRIFQNDLIGGSKGIQNFPLGPFLFNARKKILSPVKKS